MAATFGHRGSSPFVFTSNRFENRIYSFGQSAFVIAGSKMWFDSIFSDVETSYVRKCAFYSVRGLDKHFAILDEDKQRGAILGSFLSDIPFLCDSTCVSGNVIVALHFRKNGDHDLVGGIAFELGELFVETMRSFGGNGAGVIVEVSRRFRRDYFSGLRLNRDECREAERD